MHFVLILGFRSRKNDKWYNIKNLTPKENHISKTKMNLDDSLAAACEQLWRAAVSVAALKYIAGLVNTEWNGLTIKTGNGQRSSGILKNALKSKELAIIALT